MRIAEAAIATLGKNDALTVFGEIGEQRFVVFGKHLRAARHFQNDVLAACARAVLAHAMSAGLRLEVLLVAIVDQRVEAVDAFGDDVAAVPAIAAVRTAEFDEFLAPERHRTGAAGA